jgi:EpsI family protein
MMKKNRANQQPIVAVTLAASLLMFFFGVAYRVLAAKLEGPVATKVLSSTELQRLPLQIGDWIGKEVPLDEAIVLATDTDAHVNRRYSRHHDLENVGLYIASGVKARDLMPHRPEVCYTGQGWTLTERQSVKLPLSDGTMLPCNCFQFSHGTLNRRNIIVLDYYIVDGQYCHDVSLLRSKAWYGSGTVKYVAQIQIVASITAGVSADSLTKIVQDFAVDSAPLIYGLFDAAEENPLSKKDSNNLNHISDGVGSGQEPHSL